MAMKIIISAWQKDQAFPVEHMNILVCRENDKEKPTDEYLTTIPAHCTREQKLAVKFAFLRKMATCYPDCPTLFNRVEDHSHQEGDAELIPEDWIAVIRSY